MPQAREAVVAIASHERKAPICRQGDRAGATGRRFDRRNVALCEARSDRPDQTQPDGLLFRRGRLHHRSARRRRADSPGQGSRRGARPGRRIQRRLFQLHRLHADHRHGRDGGTRRRRADRPRRCKTRNVAIPNGKVIQSARSPPRCSTPTSSSTAPRPRTTTSSRSPAP